MDRLLEHSNNQDESLALGDPAMRGLLTNSATSATTVSSDVSNGLSGSRVQREVSVTAPQLVGRSTQETDIKVFAKPFMLQQKTKDVLSSSFGDNFALLDESIAELNRTSVSDTAGVPVSESFPFKMEEFSPPEKVSYDFGSYIHPDREAEGPDKLLNDNTLEILQGLDLPDLDMAEDSLLSLGMEDTLQGDMGGTLKDTQPASDLSSMNGGGGQGAQQVPEPCASLSAIKTEEDTEYIQLCTPGVVKQESERRSYCQLSGGGSGCVDRQPYTYGTASPTSLPDQKPPLGLFATRPSATDGWVRGNGYSEAPGLPRSREPLPQLFLPTYTFSRGALEQDVAEKSESEDVEMDQAATVDSEY